MVSDQTSQSMRVPILVVRRTATAIHLVVPGLHRLLEHNEAKAQTIGATWDQSELVLDLKGKPALVMTHCQLKALEGYIGSSSAVQLLMTDHNYRFKTWIGPVSGPTRIGVGGYRAAR